MVTNTDDTSDRLAREVAAANPVTEAMKPLELESAAAVLAQEVAIASSAIEAITALERDSGAAALAAAQSLAISNDFEDMQRRLEAVGTASNLAAALRDVESPIHRAERELALSQSQLTEAARAAAVVESSVVETARELARSQYYVGDTARSALQLEALKMAEFRVSPANQFMEKIKAIESLATAKRFSEMQETLGASLSNKLLEASRSVADQWNASLRQTRAIMRNQMAEIGKSTQAEFAKIAAIQTVFERDAFKNLSAMSALNKDLFKPLAGLDGALRDSLSERFKQINASLDHSFKASAAQAALTFSQTLPRFDERIAEAMREFQALGDLQAGDSTIAGVGTVTESSDIVSARGEIHGADAGHAEPITRSPIELWWVRLPIELKFFFWALLFIIHSAAEELVHERVKGWTEAHSEAEKQVVYNNVTQNFGEDTARRLRCIRASALKVRQEPALTGSVLDSLPRGTPVEVLESQGSWSRIRYRVPHSSDIREGWAPSGYLSFEIC
jgi:hypothetical protein